MNTDEARKLREQAEHQIMTILRELTRVTGLDLAGVEVLLLVDCDLNKEPQRIAQSVRIDLAV